MCSTTVKGNANNGETFSTVSALDNDLHCASLAFTTNTIFVQKIY